MTDNRWFVRSIFTIGLVLLGLVPAVATAQEATTVSGQVKSSPGGTPLVGAIVSIPSLRVNATTGNDGRYRLVLPAGSTGAVQLSARRIGYQTNSVPLTDRKSTRLNSSHRTISYAVFCLKKKKIT